MLSYIIAVILGVVSAFFLPERSFEKVRKHLFTISLLGLLFFMGVSLGKDPMILKKVIDYGLTAFVISVSTIIFSIFFVLVFVRLFGKKEC